MIKNFLDVDKALKPYVLEADKTFGKNITTQRVRELAKHVGNPHKRLRIIHVAGTSGKTSTCYYAAEMLRVAGKHVGLTVSPHIDSIAERVQINSRPLSEQIFCRYFDEFLQLVRAAPDKPTYFEFMMVFAFWVFSREKVDYAVVETGLGGLHDASNIADEPSKVCIITDIGIDHQNVLGRNIESIATQKAGIIHAQNLVCMYQRFDVVDEVVMKRVSEQGATLIFSLVRALTTASILPLFQQRNWLLAYDTYDALRLFNNLPKLTAKQRQKSQQVQVPGRMDISTIDGKTIVMDGAHNEQKMRAFLTSLEARFPGEKSAFLVAFKRSKDYQTVVPLIAKVASKVIVTRFRGHQDMPFTAVEPEDIQAEFLKLGFKNTKVIQESGEAFSVLRSSSDSLLVVTGSFYLVANLRSKIRKDTRKSSR